MAVTGLLVFIYLFFLILFLLFFLPVIIKWQIRLLVHQSLKVYTLRIDGFLSVDPGAYGTRVEYDDACTFLRYRQWALWVGFEN